MIIVIKININNKIIVDNRSYFSNNNNNNNNNVFEAEDFHITKSINILPICMFYILYFIFYILYILHFIFYILFIELSRFCKKNNVFKCEDSARIYHCLHLLLFCVFLMDV